MAETLIRKLTADQPLRKEGRDGSDAVALDGSLLKVFAGEKVKTGMQDAITEQVGNEKFTWVFVEAIEGPNVDMRKGFVDGDFLVREDGPTLPFEPKDDDMLPQELTRMEFANSCFLYALQFETNPAYLYALAYALSGSQWTETHVKTSDPGGVFRFSVETWERLRAEPEAKGIQAAWIKYPDAQCIVAAIVAAKAASQLKELVTDRDLNAVDLFIAHLFADTEGFGSEAAVKVLKARKEDGKQKSEAVIQAVYPENARRTAFFQRNADIFKEDGSASIEDALKTCATKLDLGFSEVDKVARQLRDEVAASLGDGIPPSPSGPIVPQPDANLIKGGIDRRKFIDELKSHPELVARLATMVKGEVGWSAPLTTKQVQLESFLNRMLVVGQSIAEGILPVWPQKRGYYPASTFARPATPAEIAEFRKDILEPAIAGSHVSEDLLGFPVTGNASGSVAKHQYQRGTRGGDLPAAGGAKESYFLEHPKALKLPRLLGSEVVTPPSAPSHATPGSGRLTIDQRTRERGYNKVLAEAQQYASKFLPPGWRAEIYSGFREGPRFHGKNQATDVRIYDEKGTPFDNYQAPSSFRVYEKFAQDTHRYLERHYPQLAKGHRWGGYFGGKINPEPPHKGGTYGAGDLMHQDFGGLYGVGMAAGSWKDGLHTAYRGYYDRPESASKGISGENASGD